MVCQCREDVESYTCVNQPINILGSSILAYDYWKHNANTLGKEQFNTCNVYVSSSFLAFSHFGWRAIAIVVSVRPSVSKQFIVRAKSL